MSYDQVLSDQSSSIGNTGSVLLPQSIPLNGLHHLGMLPDSLGSQLGQVSSLTPPPNVLLSASTFAHFPPLSHALSTQQSIRPGGTEAKRLERKLRRNSGQAYVNTKGEEVQGKMLQMIPCGCKRRCLEELTTPEEQKQVFDRFWEMGDYDIQNAYLVGCIGFKSGGESKVRHRKIYKVNLPGSKTVQVCRTAFLLMHGLSEGRVNRVMARFKEIGMVPRDQRGHKVPWHKLSDESARFIQQHILEFLNGTMIQNGLLPKGYNKAQMHRDYKVKCEENGKTAVGYATYKRQLSVLLQNGGKPTIPAPDVSSNPLSLGSSDSLPMPSLSHQMTVQSQVNPMLPMVPQDSEQMVMVAQDPPQTYEV